MVSARGALALVLCSSVVVSCQASESGQVNLEGENPLESPVSYTPVYDKEVIEKLIRSVPESPQWEYVYAHIQSVNDQAELGPGIPLEAKLSPTVNKDMAQVTIDAYSRAMGIWTFFGVDEVPAVWSLMSEEDYDWWYQRVQEIEGENPALDVWDDESDRLGHCYLDAFSFCGYGNPQASTGITFQYTIIGSEYQGEPHANTVAHEAVHFYQDYYSQTYYSYMPCWYIEGQATLIGNAISGQGERGRLIFGSSDVEHSGRPLPGDETWSVDQWKELLDDFTYDPLAMQRCTEEEWNYTLGAVLFEYLYGTYSLWEIHELTMAAAASENWESAVDNTLGISVDQLNMDLALSVHGLVQEHISER